MTAEQLIDFQTLLEKQLTEVHGNMQEHSNELNAPPANRDFVGADRAQELENQEAEDSILHSEEGLAAKVEHALSRIKNGTYGICEGCNCEIPVARLEAKPSVSLCLSCQEKHENG